MNSFEKMGKIKVFPSKSQLYLVRVMYSHQMKVGIPKNSLESPKNPGTFYEISATFVQGICYCYCMHDVYILFLWTAFYCYYMHDVHSLFLWRLIYCMCMYCMYHGRCAPVLRASVSTCPCFSRQESPSHAHSPSDSAFDEKLQDDFDSLDSTSGVSSDDHKNSRCSPHARRHGSHGRRRRCLSISCIPTNPITLLG